MLNRTLKARYNRRPATITRSIPRNGTLNRGNGSRNLFSRNRKRAKNVLSELFNQGFERRQRILDMAKSFYGFNDNKIKFLEEELDKVGVFD